MEGVYVVTYSDLECLRQVVAIYPTLEEATARALNPGTDDLEPPWYEVFWLPWGTRIVAATEIEIER